MYSGQQCPFARSMNRSRGGSNSILKRLCIICLLLSLALLGGCAGFQPAQYATFSVRARPHDQLAAASVHVNGLSVRAGDIVLGERGTAASVFLALLAEEFFPFVHSGVVAIENGHAYVYEAFATIRPRLSGPPTDAIRGRIRRVTLERFMSRQQIAAIYAPPSEVDADAVAQFARDRYLDGTPFDAYFDARDHRALYCNEFVALALSAGGAAPLDLVPIRTNASLAVVLKWLKVDTEGVIPAGALVGESQRIATLSRSYTPEQVEAYFAAKRELHARFTDDQRLGNVFRWSPLGLRLRPAVKRYMTAKIARAPDRHARDLAAH